MQPKDLKYTLKINNVAHELIHDPEGWDENTLQWARSQAYHGMIRSFSLPLRFIRHGAKLLRLEYYTKGIESKATLKIEIIDRNTWEYQLFYEGDVDFSTFQDDVTGVEVNIADMGVESKIKAFDKIKYEIERKDVIPVEVIGTVKTGSASWLPSSSIASPTVLIGLSLDLFEIDPTLVEIQTVEQRGGELESLLASEFWVIKAGAEGLKDVTIDIGYRPIIFVDKTLTFYGVVGSGTPRILWRKNMSHTNNERITIAEVVGFSLYGNEKVFLVSSSNYDATQDFHEAYFKMSYSIEGLVSKTVAMRPFVLFQKLINKMIGKQTKVESFLLKEWEQLTITSGDWIRNIPNSNITTSFSDFYKSIDSVIPIGFGIENGVPRIEKRDYWYNKRLLINNVGSVTELNITTASQYMFNSLKIGYPNQNYETDHGRDEFNAGQEYGLEITRIIKAEDIISVYRADQKGVEETALKGNENLKNKDKKGDKSIFFLYLEKTKTGANWKLESSTAFNNVEGVNGLKINFNLRISPKQNLIRHLQWIKSFYARGQITFKSADKNTNLKTTDENGTFISESADIDMIDHENPVFAPYIATFKATADKRIMFTMQSVSNGFIQFEFLGNQYLGFILETSIDASKNSVQEYKLLLTPNNNISKLIH